ncbi:hypothetical protein Q9966_016803 [Columba livia]|nr:hypothetical protein Q9966_016803 [Columba livia]
MISDRDEDALSYMTNLQVEEFGQARSGCSIRFLFSVNPYFQNDVVAKEFVRGPSGELVSHSTPHPVVAGQDPRSQPPQGTPDPPELFRLVWGSQFPCGGSDRRDHQGGAMAQPAAVLPAGRQRRGDPPKGQWGGGWWGGTPTFWGCHRPPQSFPPPPQ